MKMLLYYHLPHLKVTVIADAECVILCVCVCGSVFPVENVHRPDGAWFWSSGSDCLIPILGCCGLCLY